MVRFRQIAIFAVRTRLSANAYENSAKIGNRVVLSFAEDGLGRHDERHYRIARAST